MPIRLDRVPIPDVASEVGFRRQRVRVRGNQIILWVTVSPRRLGPPDPRLTPFPAVLDTGYNHTLAVQERHLVEWSGLDPETLPEIGHARDRGRRISLDPADVWIHRTEPGSHDRLTGDPPHAVSAAQGIAVYPSAQSFPRLPLLGLRAITRNRLILVVNGYRREATLRTAFAWWPSAGRSSRFPPPLV
jgi:hypothetical protein